MDNFHDTFIKKITFIMNMVEIYGKYCVPFDFFYVSVSNRENVSKTGINEYGTTFKMKSLLDLYKDEYFRIMKACKVKTIKDQKKQTVTFVSNS